ncbi:MAG: hypothetical protein IPI73_25155 [Betaproteobacteria bacterium]|nr:hypothetical protein [Betaproteobacteria bacterium]
MPVLFALLTRTAELACHPALIVFLSPPPGPPTSKHEVGLAPPLLPGVSEIARRNAENPACGWSMVLPLMCIVNVPVVPALDERLMPWALTWRMVLLEIVRFISPAPAGNTPTPEHPFEQPEPTTALVPIVLPVNVPLSCALAVVEPVSLNPTIAIEPLSALPPTIVLLVTVKSISLLADLTYWMPSAFALNVPKVALLIVLVTRAVVAVSVK